MYQFVNLNWGCLCWEGFPGSSDGKASVYNVGDLGSIPGSGRSPGEGIGNPLQYLAWRIPWTEEPGRLQAMGSQRVRHYWATSLSFFLSLLRGGGKLVGDFSMPRHIRESDSSRISLLSKCRRNSQYCWLRPTLFADWPNTLTNAGVLLWDCSPASIPPIKEKKETLQDGDLQREQLLVPHSPKKITQGCHLGPRREWAKLEK